MLKINMEFRKGILFVRFKGILDKKTSCIVNDEVSKLIKDNGIKYLVFNLKGISYIDRVGIKILLDNYRTIASIDGKVVICGSEKIITKMALNNLVDLYQSNSEIGAFEIINV